MNFRIGQIVPSLVPGLDGLGDYAHRLASVLGSANIETTFFVAGHRHRDHRHAEERGLNEALVVQLRDNNPETLANALSFAPLDVVIVHMSGYGYADKGAPNWLVNGLEQYKYKSDSKIITVFHELWQKPVPWKKTLIRWYFQRHAIRRLFKISDGYVTNTRERFERILGPWDKRKPGFWMPVFSNIGELEHFPNKENGLAVIFGLHQGRRRVYEALSSNLNILPRLGIKQLIDIGDPAARIPARLSGFISPLGRLDEKAASELLTRAQYGFLSYDVAGLAKSGVFNAYAAHGVCAVNLRKSSTNAVGLERGRHYLTVAEASNCLHPNQKMSRQAGEAIFDWYKDHNLSKTTEAFVKLIYAVISKADK